MTPASIVAPDSPLFGDLRFPERSSNDSQSLQRNPKKFLIMHALLKTYRYLVSFRRTSGHQIDGSPLLRNAAARIFALFRGKAPKLRPAAGLRNPEFSPSSTAVQQLFPVSRPSADADALRLMSLLFPIAKCGQDQMCRRSDVSPMHSQYVCLVPN